MSPAEVELQEVTRGERIRAGLVRGFPKFVEKAFSPRVLASFRVTFGTALLAALVNLFLGGIIAYALVRIKIPGKRILDALIDLPFAMPTAICGSSFPLRRNSWALAFNLRTLCRKAT